MNLWCFKMAIVDKEYVMGSPNFDTNSDILVNVAIDYENQEDYTYDIVSDYHKAELFVKSIETWFYHLELNAGYHSGFQIAVRSTYDDYIESVLKDWAEYKQFYDCEGRMYDLVYCEYFKRSDVNVTRHNLESAMKRELKYLTNLVETFAKNNGMGRVVGKTWTSSVNYDWSIV